MRLEKIPAVILAGGKAGDSFAVSAGVAYKALAPVAGRPMVAYVADALERAGRVGERIVVGPPEVAAALPGVRHVPDAGSFLGNISAGMAAVPGAAAALIITCDIPFVTPEILDSFVEKALAAGVDLAYPIVRLALCEERFPGMHRTSLNVREGRITGGNAVVMRREFLTNNARLIEDVYAARKQPLRLAGMMGWGFVLRVLLSPKLPGVLPLGILEARIGRMIGGVVAAIELADPEIGADIDKPEDLAGVME